MSIAAGRGALGSETNIQAAKQETLKHDGQSKQGLWFSAEVFTAVDDCADAVFQCPSPEAARELVRSRSIFAGRAGQSKCQHQPTARTMLKKSQRRRRSKEPTATRQGPS